MLGEHSFETGAAAARHALTQLQEKTDQDPSLVIVFASVVYNQQEIVRGVRHVVDAPLVGSSTAGEITADGPTQETVTVMVLSSDTAQFTVASSGPIIHGDSFEAGKKLATAITAHDPHITSLVMFPDVLVGNGADVVRGIQAIVHKDFPIVGGASGDDQKFETTYQYCNDEVFSESVVGFGISGDYHFGVGVRHGWIPIGIPMYVTKSEGATVHEIDNKPALDVYKEYFGEHHTKRLEDDRAVYTNTSVLTYPFGITAQNDNEILIRFATDVSPEGSITCAAEIPEGSEIRMMIGNKDQAIEASQIAAGAALDGLVDPYEIGAVIVFNCIARHNLFGEDAYREINAIREVLGNDVPMIGFYTYGEQAPINGVSRDIKKCESSFHNETVVIYTLQ